MVVSVFIRWKYVCLDSVSTFTGLLRVYLTLIVQCLLNKDKEKGRE